MRRRSNVTRVKFPKQSDRSDFLKLDQDILSGLSAPKDVSPLSEKVVKDFAQQDRENRSELHHAEIQAHYSAQSSNAIAVLEARVERYKTELTIAEKLADKVEKEASNSSQVQKEKQKTTAPENQKAWFTRTFGGMDPEDQFKSATYLSAAAVASTIGGVSILEYLSEYSDAVAANPLLAVPIMGVPLIAGVGLELMIEKISNEQTRKKATLAVCVTCIGSFLGVLVGLSGMSVGGGGVLSAPTGGIPKGLRVTSQIVFEVTAISLIVSSFLGIMRQYWPQKWGTAKKAEAHRAEHQRIIEEVVIPRRSYHERALFWAQSYKAHREEFILRQCAAFKVACDKHDAWHG